MRLLSALLCLAALGAAIPAASRASAQSATSPRIVTDMAVTQSLVAAVTGGPVAALLDPGADPHHAHLRPSQARALAAADLVIWVGPGLTPWLERALDGRDAATVMALEAIGGRDDAHAWLDPAVGRAWVRAIAERLAGIDPDRAATYAANADRAEARIAAAAAAAQERLAAAQGRAIIVRHDAYDAFAAAFGLRIAGALAESDAAPPGARRLSEMRDLAAAGDVACLFDEPGADPRPVARLAEETGLPTGILDLQGATLAPGPDLYPQLIEGMAEAIAVCIAPAR